MSTRQGAILGHVAVETTDIDADVAVMTQTLGLTEVRWGIHVLTGKRIVMLGDSVQGVYRAPEEPEREAVDALTELNIQFYRWISEKSGNRPVARIISQIMAKSGFSTRYPTPRNDAGSHSDTEGSTS